MKLYFIPGACSLAAHIALREASLPFCLAPVDHDTRRVGDGGYYRVINPGGMVPALALDDGRLIKEVLAIFVHVAALVPERALLPPYGTRAHVEAMQWLSFVATEIHKSFSPLFRPTTPEAFIRPGRIHLRDRLGTVEAHLSGRSFLVSGAYSLADAYLMTVCRWLGDQDMTIADWPALSQHFDRIASRPAVREALAAEGLEAVPFDAT